MDTSIYHLRDGSSDSGDLASRLADVEDWQLVVPPETAGFRDDYRKTLWLGGTADGRFWFLATAQDELEPFRDVVIAVSHPGTRDIGYLSTLMFRALAVVQNEQTLSKEAADEIVTAVPTPSYRLAAEYLSELPNDWLSLPCDLVVGFTLSEGAHVSRATFKEYRRDSLLEALQVLKGGRHDGILIRYLLQTRGAVPFLFWDADFPLARKSKSPPTERKKVQSSVPWEAEADTTLLEIYQHLPSQGIWSSGPPYFGEPTLRLRVGGRTEAEATANWGQCARSLRRLAASQD